MSLFGRDDLRPYRLISYIPAFLLIVIAVYQIHLAYTAGLSPWKGGGFGMFSSTQPGLARYVRIFVSAPDRSEELDVPQSLIDPADRAATLPTDRQMRKLAIRIVEREQRKQQPVAQVRIEAWCSEYDKVTLASVTTRIRDYVYNVD